VSSLQRHRILDYVYACYASDSPKILAFAVPRVIYGQSLRGGFPTIAPPRHVFQFDLGLTLHCHCR
jgi:hypothetical protein